MDSHGCDSLDCFFYTVAQHISQTIFLNGMSGELRASVFRLVTSWHPCRCAGNVSPGRAFSPWPQMPKSAILKIQFCREETMLFFFVPRWSLTAFEKENWKVLLVLCVRVGLLYDELSGNLPKITCKLTVRQMDEYVKDHVFIVTWFESYGIIGLSLPSDALCHSAILTENKNKHSYKKKTAALN